MTPRTGPRSTTDALPIKYVLYTHYSYEEKGDFAKWTSAPGAASLSLPGVKYFTKHLQELRTLLAAPGREGLLVLFFAAGYPEFLAGLAKKEGKEALRRNHPKLQFADDIRDALEARLRDQAELAKDPDFHRRVRVITPLDLYDLVGGVNAVRAEGLLERLLGHGQYLQYDAPKTVEAVLRLRLLGTGIPVFRIDQDVLFYETNAVQPGLGLADGVAVALEAHKVRRDDPRVFSFVFSGSYDSSGVLRPRDPEAFDRWSGAFATRIHPALSVDRTGLEEAEKTNDWASYTRKFFEPEEAFDYLGLARGTLNAPWPPRGIAQFGAHPTLAVISGALLCLGEGTVLHVPPFSNFALNVMWIDDHLRYALLRELRQVDQAPLTAEVAPDLVKARVTGVAVTKGRPPISDLPKYVLATYLPRLLWGTVVDAWINPDPRIKWPRDAFRGNERELAERESLRHGLSKGKLPGALQRALGRGSFSQAERRDLRGQLREEAIRRINAFRKYYWGPENDGPKTFISYWVRGYADSWKDVFPGPALERLRMENQGAGWGIPSDGHGTGPVTYRTLNPALADELDVLIEDVLQYVDWTLDWPGFVQVIRAAEQGSVRMDTLWNPLQAAPSK